MVRNTNGGNNQKRQGRKHAQGVLGREMRRAVEGEMYGCVKEMSGGNLCMVAGTDDALYRCHIGGKYRGRNKRANYITKGSWVLVGEREWENKKTNVDLLYVYDKNEKEQLQNEASIDVGNLDDEEDEEGGGGIKFTDNEIVTKEEIDVMILGNIKQIETKDEEINIDDL